MSTMTCASAGGRRATMPKQTMTGAMLNWAVEHHRETGEQEFRVETRFRRAASQHYHGTWVVDGHWVTLHPPSIHATTSTYRITVEVDDV